ncbi:hypothetical protein AFL01nite_02440 [Aeromicrobium flavum]|uniref:Uncharacterized protein n=1 Tax=Aeromicrobium flavum TaxID=416568 RepID=A0A512HR39_9ACTN|nr:hypothetical protein [Aeromicrobium flavum]GEO87917.1 hypothetical protein AFL01nite_02440 [Aeromicrobium flavum]
MGDQVSTVHPAHTDGAAPSWARGVTWALVSAAVTPAAMVLITIVVERRPFVVSDQYAGFIIGDILLAIAVGVGASAPGSTRVPRWAFVGASFTAIAFGAWQMWNEVQAGVYSISEALSPSKLWHQFVVYPVLSMLLLSSTSRAWRHKGRTLVVLALVFGWMACLLWDQTHPKSPHCSYDWRSLACT